MNSQGITIQWTAIDIWMLQYDLSGAILSNLGEVSQISVSDKVIMALPTTQYIATLSANNNGIATKLYY